MGAPNPEKKSWTLEHAPFRSGTWGLGELETDDFVSSPLGLTSLVARPNGRTRGTDEDPRPAPGYLVGAGIPFPPFPPSDKITA